MSSSKEQNHTTAFEKHMDNLKKESPLHYDLYRELNSFVIDKNLLNIDSEWKKIERKIKILLNNKMPDKDYENK
tara:strand:+ start:80 stop:301 length:222 start_codon:yes stop_codon:yes gene_type:complete